MQIDIAGGGARQPLHRAGHPEQLLDGTGQQPRVGHQSSTLCRVLGEECRRPGQQAGRRVVAPAIMTKQ